MGSAMFVTGELSVHSKGPWNDKTVGALTHVVKHIDKVRIQDVGSNDHRGATNPGGSTCNQCIDGTRDLRA